MAVQDIWIFSEHISLVKNGHRIYPYSGTFKRSGDDEKTPKLPSQRMTRRNRPPRDVVDLSRNDPEPSLAAMVHVKAFNEGTYYSH